jgi:hypothetical protein
VVFELIAYGTGSPTGDVRYREYTSSRRRAEMFAAIPKIQFTDSGHGVVFVARDHKGRRSPEVRDVAEYVRKHMVSGKAAEG